MKPVSFVGHEGDIMTLGVTEGGGAPMLTIYAQSKGPFVSKWASFCFESPQQVNDLIDALAPFKHPQFITKDPG
jgi:hypothetical protein